MAIQPVSITIDRQARHITPGLVKGQDLIHLAAIEGTEQLLLEIQGDIDIPVGPDDRLLIIGGESFSIGDGSPDLDDNPRLRNPIRCLFNGETLSEAQALKRAKIEVTEFKRLDPTAVTASRLLADLDGLADELIEDHHKIIVKPSDQFVVMPPDGSPHPDREVLVKIDDREVMLPVGPYVVSDLKRKLGVSAEYELNLIKHGELLPLDDSAVFKLRKSETFVSVPRTGCSS